MTHLAIRKFGTGRSRWSTESQTLTGRAIKEGGSGEICDDDVLCRAVLRPGARLKAGDLRGMTK